MWEIFFLNKVRVYKSNVGAALKLLSRKALALKKYNMNNRVCLSLSHANMKPLFFVTARSCLCRRPATFLYF